MSATDHHLPFAAVASGNMSVPLMAYELPTLSEDSEEQPSNIPLVFQLHTFEVSQPERSSEARDEQPWNMERMFVTREVSQPETSREPSVVQ